MNFCKELRVKPESKVKLKQWDPSNSGDYDKANAVELLEGNLRRLIKHQNLLYAENKRSLLIVMQGMDTSGKDGAIRHVMKGINPQGTSVVSFKTPSNEELDHDYLWRVHKAVPARGDVGVFNRSHYEDVLVVRVRGLISKDECKARYKQINNFERMLSENGTTILKFFLHISQDEQKERLQARLEDPTKNWKFNENDLKERKFWDEYTDAYEKALSECSTEWAPWYVIPANKKWFRNLAISEIINSTLEDMNLKFPAPLADLKKIKIS